MKEVGALIQVITYNEFLPALGVTLQSYPGYLPSKMPDIRNTFATASYRLGHTMVSDDVLLFDNNCEEVEPGEMELVEVFWNPALVAEHGIDVFLKGAGTHLQYQTDTKINDVLRNFLFGNPSDPVRFGIDLGSLNIQRGRDHGLPDYNTARKFYTGRSAKKFSDITKMDTVASDLSDLYGSVDNIDLWLGILAEDHIPGTSVGRTLHEMLRVQFEALRDGDYYFYLYDPYLPENIREQIKNTKFSDVIKRNTGLSNTVENVMHVEPCPGQEEEKFVKDSSKQKIILPEAKTGVRIYPNPATDVVNINLSGVAGPSTVKIYSSNGELLKTLTTSKLQNYLQVNISGLKKGVYSIQLISVKEMKSFTFVKM